MSITIESHAATDCLLLLFHAMNGTQSLSLSDNPSFTHVTADLLQVFRESQVQKEIATIKGILLQGIAPQDLLKHFYSKGAYDQYFNHLDKKKAHLLLQAENAFMQLLNLTSFCELWDKAIFPFYPPYLNKFWGWINNHDPILQMNDWLHTDYRINITINASFFLPPPPDGRLGMFYQENQHTYAVELLFGIPRYGQFSLYGMHQTWLRRGIWHYCIAILRPKLEEIVVHNPHYTDLIARIHHDDETKILELATNYVLHALTVIILEQPDEQVMAINHLRGSGYVGMPWMVRAFCDAHAVNSTFPYFIEEALNTFVVLFNANSASFALFTGPIEACFQKIWVKDALLVMPPEVQDEPGLRYRLKALARLHKLTITKVSQTTELATYSQWLVGMPQAHPLIEKILQDKQIQIDADGIRGFNQYISGHDLLLTFLYPHPTDPKKWILVTTATSLEALKRVGRDQGYREADFWISSPNSVVASGLYGKQSWGVEIKIEHLSESRTLIWPQVTVPYRASRDHEGLLTDAS